MPVVSIPGAERYASPIRMTSIARKRGNDVTPPDDVGRIYKTKRMFASHRREMQTIQSGVRPAAYRGIHVVLEPSHP